METLLSNNMQFQEFYDFVVKVHSIAKIGLTYSTDPYALENYQELNELSKDMLEKFMDVKFDKPSLFTKEVYPTPNISCRTLIVNDKNEILFVKEARTNNWSLPGGWCDLYKSPSESALAEISQEAGVEAKITKLLAVLDRRPYKSQQSVPDYVLIFLGETKGKFHEHTHETNDVRYFPMDKLPELSRKLSIEEINRAIDAYKNNKVIFD